MDEDVFTGGGEFYVVLDPIPMMRNGVAARTHRCSISGWLPTSRHDDARLWSLSTFARRVLPHLSRQRGPTSVGLTVGNGVFFACTRERDREGKRTDACGLTRVRRTPTCLAYLPCIGRCRACQGTCKARRVAAMARGSLLWPWQSCGCACVGARQRGRN